MQSNVDLGEHCVSVCTVVVHTSWHDRQSEASILTCALLNLQLTLSSRLISYLSFSFGAYLTVTLSGSVNWMLQVRSLYKTEA